MSSLKDYVNYWNPKRKSKEFVQLLCGIFPYYGKPGDTIYADLTLTLYHKVRCITIYKIIYL